LTFLQPGSNQDAILSYSTHYVCVRIVDEGEEVSLVYARLEVRNSISAFFSLNNDIY